MSDIKSMNDYYGGNYDPAELGMIIGITGVITLIAYAISSLLMSFLFKKAGVEMWKAWVPIYNTWVFLELGGQKGYWVLLNFLAIIPFIGWIASIAFVVFSAMAAYNIGLTLGKGGVWVVLYIFLPIIWFAVLAFDSSQWRGRNSSSYGVDNDFYSNQKNYPQYPPVN